MVSGRNPWYVASPKTDEGFRLFLRAGAPWLQANLPISAGAAHILGRIFELDPAARITLPELRAAVEALDTFFPSSSSSSPVPVSVSVAVKAASVPAPSSSSSSSSAALPDSAGQLRPLDLVLPSALSTRFLSFSTEALAAAATATLVNAETSTASHFSDALDDIWSLTAPRPGPATPDTASASGGSSSGEESSGPDTPETFAADHDAEVASPNVPELVLDSAHAHAQGHAPEGVDVNAAVAVVKSEEETRKKRRRGSLKAMMDGMRRMRLRTHA